MATLSSSKSSSGLRAERKQQKHSSRCVETGTGAMTATRFLTLEEAVCPVCLEIFLEPVTMPCRHSVCLPCFKRTVELSSLCCPLCRLRVSSWARRHTRDRTLVNTELWDLVRRSHPDRCKRRMESKDVQAVEDEIIFLAPPVHLCKPGELRQEYEKHMKKLVNEKEEGDRASEELIQKILEDDRRYLEKKRQQQRKGEAGALQLSQEPVNLVLSDSENEEPVGGRTRHRSAFVKRTRKSPDSCRSGLHCSGVQRSQSCTDTQEESRAKIRCPSHAALMAKGVAAYSSNSGILLSSENSRSFSAPNLTSDKRQTCRSLLGTSAASTAPLSKPERSISPESNDSISEELNHFKPIVCSPCTPPKRLPDGRVLEPTIVKSTPLNLSRSLQKSTTYEASPTILQKWKQIEQDRHKNKAASKGTITVSLNEDFAPKARLGGLHTLPPGNENQRRAGCPSSDETLAKASFPAAMSQAGGLSSEKGMTSIGKKRRLIFDQPEKEDCRVVTRSETEHVPLTVNPQQVTCETVACKNKPAGQAGRQKPEDICRPTSQRGMKRSQKTKHLEEGGKAKRLRPSSRVEMGSECDSNSFDGHWSQREEDCKLALKLQRQFDLERRNVDRRKGTPDNYLIRSWNNSDVKQIPRRSGRMGKRK
ncbi:E3 ubiquitin-protein ligase RNF169-like [Acipenser ruthenus]|uniref:E3 ubiquitin-protein ligase RNF169-like n=1 Tax=Acipenser ruthenus TaxID=7906 RepID=UPI002741BB8F|nr:E3 ubiquitin-protein ligase RNF169-like [Acipenser ruthenus]